MKLNTRILAVVLTLVATMTLRSIAGDPRAIIQRAIQARGGDDTLPPDRASVTTTQGTLVIGTLRTPFKGRISMQGSKMKLLMQVEVGDTLTITAATDGTEGWRNINGEQSPYDADDLRRHRESVHMEWLIQLTPLLQKGQATLTHLGESKLKGKAVDEVKVEVKDMPDVTLSFDQATGLLMKTAYRRGEEGHKLEETYFMDYRSLDPTAEEGKALQAAGIKMDGPSLLAFLKNHTGARATRMTIEKLIRRLGSEDFEAREQAQKDLIALGGVAAPYLEEALKEDDPEVVRRAEACLDVVKRHGQGDLVLSATRVVARLQPPGTARVLLDLLPGAEKALATEIRSALCHIGERQGAPDQDLVGALNDEDPLKKAAAAGALGKDGGRYRRLPGRRLYPPTTLNHFCKTEQFLDGKKECELELIRMEYFNQLEDEVFGKP